MAFDDRLGFLLLGMLIGFVLGRFTRLDRNVRKIKEELDEVDDIVKKHLGNADSDNNQDGFMRFPWVANVAVLLVVGLTAWASIVSQKASNDVQDAQETQANVVHCTKRVLSEALTVLNERSVYTTEQIHANIKTQTDFKKFLDLILHEPPYSSQKQLNAAHNYQKSLDHFVAVSTKQKKKAENNPFPTDKELDTCLSNAAERTK